MKLIICIYTLLIVMVLSLNCVKTKSCNDCSLDADNARWMEKSRWAKFMNDSIGTDEFKYKINHMIGNTSDKEYIKQLEDLLGKTFNPFYTTK